MADKRIYSLVEIPGDKTGYSIPLDKSGNSEAYMVMYEDIITEAVADAMPTVSTPTITESTAIEVTTTISKKAVIGKMHTFNLVFSLTLPTEPLDTTILLTGDSIGTVGQCLPCLIVSATTLYNCYATISDDSPTTIRLQSTATLGGAVTIYINGTLITTS